MRKSDAKPGQKTKLNSSIRFVLGTEPKYCKNIKINCFDIFPRAIFGRNFEILENNNFNFTIKNSPFFPWHFPRNSRIGSKIDIIGFFKNILMGVIRNQPYQSPFIPLVILVLKLIMGPLWVISYGSVGEQESCGELFLLSSRKFSTRKRLSLYVLTFQNV